jgi:hypothetical protein
VGKASRKKKEAKVVPLAEPYSVPFGPEVTAILKKSEREFEAKHGRPPGPDDLVFGDVDRDEATAYMVARLRASGAGEDVIGAYLATDRIVLPKARANLPPSAVAEWDAALAEARRQNPESLPTNLDTLEKRIEDELKNEARASRPH